MSDADSYESLLEDSENPWTCALVLSGLDGTVGAHADNSNYQRACHARARLGILICLLFVTFVIPNRTP
jgi:hypothetical protein